MSERYEICTPVPPSVALMKFSSPPVAAVELVEFSSLPAATIDGSTPIPPRSLPPHITGHLATCHGHSSQALKHLLETHHIHLLERPGRLAWQRRQGRLGREVPQHGDDDGAGGDGVAAGENLVWVASAVWGASVVEFVAGGSEAVVVGVEEAVDGFDAVAVVKGWDEPFLGFAALSSRRGRWC